MNKLCLSRDVVRLLGDDALKGSSLSVQDGDTVHFMVTEQKGSNYRRFCNQIVPPQDPVGIIQQYTEHTTSHYARVNLALAADTDGLVNFGEYVSQLRASISARPLLDDGIVYRGVELSREEIDQMEKLQNFFIPSFTSTSVERSKAYDKPSMMVIKLPYATPYACSITAELSRYHEQESEVLLSCYSAFRLERIEQDGHKKIISLYLDEHLSAMPFLHPPQWEYSF